MRLIIENDLSSFSVLTGKQNANSATKKMLFDLNLHAFLELKIGYQVSK